MNPNRHLQCVTYGCIVVTNKSCQRSPKSRAPKPCTQTAPAFRPSAGCCGADGKRLRPLSSSSLSLSPASPGPETTGSHQRYQNRLHRQALPEIGSATALLRQHHRSVAERTRQPSAPRGFAAETKAWLSGSRRPTTTTLFNLNIASIVSCSKNWSKPTNFSFPKYATFCVRGVISPLLANQFLHYAFDRWLAAHYPQVPFERYADDVMVHCRTEKEAQQRRQAIAARLQSCGL